MADALAKGGVPFHVMESGGTANAKPVGELLDKVCGGKKASLVVTDFCPLRTKKAWLAEALKAKCLDGGKTPLVEVDAHNVVPLWITSEKCEFA